MLALAKLDAKMRNILDMANIYLYLPLHGTAEHHPNPGATKLLARHQLQARHYPPALLAKFKSSNTPLDLAFKFNKSPAVVPLMH